jgi:predicted Zn finger-like uncharacterized protein
MSVACPRCRARYTVPASASGKKIRCKKCGQSFRIAVTQSAAPVEDSPQLELVEPPALPGTPGPAAATAWQALVPPARSAAARPLSRRKVLVVVLVLLGAVGAAVLVATLVQDGGGLPRGGSLLGGPVTEANFRKLKVEMTLADVESILGQGKELPDEEIPGGIQEHITPEVKGKIQIVEPKRWRQWNAADNSIFVGLSETDEGDRVSVLAFVHGGSFKLDCGNPWAFRAALAAAGKKPDEPAKKAQGDAEKPKASEPKPPVKKTKPTEDQLRKALTRENHARLKKGMTEKEVVDILGPPTSNRIIERHAGFVSRQMIWQLKQAFIIAVFHNGRLDGTDSGDGNGGPLPSEKPGMAPAVGKAAP